MIDINKKYRTRDGRKVVLYTVDGVDKNYPVVGEAINKDGGSFIQRWHMNGVSTLHQLCLIEVTDKIKCEENDGFYISAEKLDYNVFVSIHDSNECLGVHLTTTKTRQLIQMLQEAIDD